MVSNQQPIYSCVDIDLCFLLKVVAFLAFFEYEDGKKKAELK